MSNLIIGNIIALIGSILMVCTGLIKKKDKIFLQNLKAECQLIFMLLKINKEIPNLNVYLATNKNVALTFASKTFIKYLMNR